MSVIEILRQSTKRRIVIEIGLMGREEVLSCVCHMK